MITAIHDDLFARDVINDPYSYFGHLREEDLVHWNEKYQVWIITRHADLVWITRHPELFSSELPMRPPPYPPIDALDLGLFEVFRKYQNHWSTIPAILSAPW